MSTEIGGLTDACFTGFKHEGTPVGKTISIADIPTYVSQPPKTDAPKKVILFLSDIHGPFFINNQLLQDYFASHGFFVAGIDYFFGERLDKIMHQPGFNRQEWASKARKIAGEALPKWIEGVTELYGNDAKYAAVGYCFGAPYAMDLAATEKIVATAFAHPSSLEDDSFRALKRPLFLSCAETDRAFDKDARRRAEDILIDIKAQYTFQVFSGVDHGFAVRGDPNDPDQRWAKEESARGIIGWFTRFTG